MKLYLHNSKNAGSVASLFLVFVLNIAFSISGLSTPIPVEDGLGRTLSFSKQVGSIQGNFSVNPIGGAQYSIPFNMPPGVNGLVPGLGVSYNSNAGNGLLGWGWDLSGIMTISRGPTSRLQEGYIKGISQTSSDRFYLNGTRLILTSGTYGSSSSQYRLEDDNGILVKYNSDNFDVYMPNGTIYTLAEKTIGTATLIWYLSKIRDLYGNEINYTYQTLNSEKLLTTITYASNTILLNYTTRTADSNTTYMDGKALYQKNILLNVEIKADNETQYKYEFVYIEDMYKLLNVIKLFGKNSAELNPTIINWSNNYIAPVKHSITSSMKALKYYGDFNGDGRTDIISIPENYASTNGNARVSICNSSGIGFTETDLAYGIEFDGITVSDFNNDGKDEIYLLHEKSVIIGSGHPPAVQYQCKFSYYYYSSSQNKLIADTSKDIIYTPVSGTNLKMIAEDFNSDGKTDYLVYNLTSNSFYAKSFSSEGGNLTVNPSFNLSNAKVIDFNGNGVPDLHVGSKVYEYYKPSGKFELIKSGLPTINYQYGARAGDLNGDGKTDFFNIGANYEYTIYYSNGKNLVQKTAPFSAFTSPDVVGPYENIQLMDFNGDGKADILRLYFDIIKDVQSTAIYVTPVLKGNIYYSKGDNFYTENINHLFNDFQFFTKFYIKKPRDPSITVDIENDFEPYEPFITLDPNIFPAIELLDFNGDGNADIIAKKPNDASTPYEVVTFSPNQRDRIVTLITNGLNVNTQIEYANIYDSGVYTTSSTNYSYPLVKFKAPVYVVKKVNTLNDGSYYSSVDYDYTDAILHKEYGFLGFMKFTEHQQPKNIKSETTFETIGSRYRLRAKTTIVKTGSGSSMSTSTLTNLENTVTAQNGTRYYQSRVSSSILTDHLKGFTNTTSFTSYNQTNNQPAVISESLGSDFDRTTTITYSPVSGTYWLPNRMTQTVVSQKHKDDASNYNVTTSYVYNSSAPYKLDSKTMFSGTAKNVKETYTYHTKGGLASISRKAADVATPRLTTYIYDSDGKFITKQKASDYIWEDYTYDKMGRVKTVKDQDNLQTSHTYDNFGNHQSSTLPDGSTVSSSMAFTSSGPSGSLFYTQRQQTGKGYTKQYYNRLGQLLREESPGFNQSVIKKDYTYDSNGRTYREYIPYASSVGSYSQYSYDAYGRITTVNLPNSLGTTTYQYTGSTTRVTTPSGWSEVTTDAAGLDKQAKDAGGTISKTFFSNGLPKTHIFGSNAMTFTYDEQGNRTSMYSPNTGTTSSTYNAFGEIKTQVDARSVSYSMQYDDLGRLHKKLVGGITETQWNYANNGQLNSINGIDVDITYTYDNLKRLTDVSETVNGQTFLTQYDYNSNSLISKVTYPGNFAVNRIYDTNGILTEIKRNDNNTSIWLLQDVTNHGAIEQFKYGNGLISNYSYDANLRPQKMKSGSVFEWDYTFANNGNLSNRKNVKLSNQTQTFAYDALNRLTSYRSGSMTYEANGNIATKPDVGTYNYNGGKPNAVSQITSPVSSYDPFHETITYTDFQKVESITDQENNHRLDFTYGPDYGRRMMKTLEGGSLKKTKYYSNGLYEKIVNDLGQTKEINYISGSSGLAAVFIKDFDSSQKMYYVHQDYLGSILALTNESGAVAERYYFDAWGNRKNPSNWSQSDSRTNFILDRGFTGHEHLDHFNLINMNGRVYDAKLGSFLSADPVIQAPNYTQDLNLYSYAYGNPLKYTDPSGYFEAPRPDSRYERSRSKRGGGAWFLNSTHIVPRTGPSFYDYMMNNMWGDLQDFVTNSSGNLNLTFNGQNALYDAISYVYSSAIGVGGLINGVITPEQIDAYEKLSNKNISNIAVAGAKALLGYEDLNLTGSALNKVINSPATNALDKSLIERAIADPKYETEAYSFRYKTGVEYGGKRAPGDMTEQLLGFWKSQYRATWKVAGNELTWLLRHARVSGWVSVDKLGTITIQHSLYDVFDLRPSPGRSGAYRTVTRITGGMWHDILGASEPTINANWRTVYP